HELFRRAVRRVTEVLAEAAGERSPADGGAASSRRARSSAIQVHAVPQGALFPACDPAAEWSAVCGPEQAHQLGERFIREHAELFDPGFRAWMEMSLEVPMAEYQRARRRRFEHVRRFDELLDGDTVLLSPVLCYSEQHADGRLPGAGQPGVPTDLENTYAANITGHPAISLPAGRVPSGVGCGLMVTGPRLGDDMLLALAELWEAAEPWPRVASGYDEFTVGLPL
ncbi:MAG: hypothetical protein FJ000_07050, partial [Actinobacteria bacterium]|nr:hypothetical protein [Actinomycetota bacterium]